MTKGRLVIIIVASMASLLFWQQLNSSAGNQDKTRNDIDAPTGVHDHGNGITHSHDSDDDVLDGWHLQENEATGTSFIVPDGCGTPFSKFIEDKS